MNIQLPLITSLFTPFGATWDFFANDSTDKNKNDCAGWLAISGCNAMISLLAAAPGCPHVVDFFKDGFGKTADWNKLQILERWAMVFHNAGAAFIPCLHNDGIESAVLRDAPWEQQVRAVQLFTAILNPYVPAYLIGLENSETMSNEHIMDFYRLFKHYSPNHYIGTHMQWNPADRPMPQIDFCAYEHSWCPTTGQNHSPQDCVNELNDRRSKTIVPLWPVEYIIEIWSNLGKDMSRAMLASGAVGVGGPIK